MHSSSSSSDNDTAEPAKQHPVPCAPAPWTTKAECYWMFLTLGNELPRGVYDSLQEEEWLSKSEGKAMGEFKGGLGCVMVVRYRDTPVGPYDELMLIPGNFTVPQPPGGGPPKIPKKALRICRIYVSQRTTNYNGRLNWNIPKHLARFSFSAPPTPAGGSPPKSLTIKVFPPSSSRGDGVGPFFACTLRPFQWLPSMHVSTNWLPLSTTHAQPPLPEAPGFKAAAQKEIEGKNIDQYDISSKNSEEALLTGTDRWCAFPIQSISRARGCWVKIHSADEDVEGSSKEAIEKAGKYFPQEIRPWSVGAWMEDAELSIPEPIAWKL